MGVHGDHPNRAVVNIHRLYGTNDEAGSLVATVVLYDYKGALSNARECFVRDKRPPAGRYLAVTEQQYGTRHQSMIFEVKYAVAQITSNDRSTLVGEDFGWSPYAERCEPEWTFVLPA